MEASDYGLYCGRVSMKHHALDLDRLVMQSLKVRFDEFSQLILDIAQMLRREDGQVGPFRVKGRLVELPHEGETIVVGDLHGDLESLTNILKTSDFVRKAQRGEKTYLVFMGDYGDRGANPVEVYYLILTLKKTYQENVVLMRGNHEGPDDLQVSPHDLPFQLVSRFGENGSTAYGMLRALFDQLYMAVLLEGRCIFLHGGVPSEARSLDDVAFAHAKHPEASHLTEILWSDPRENIAGTCPSPRGAGKLFGPDVTKKFLKMLGVHVLVRGHEPVDEGFRISHDERVLTLFSRKGDPYFNKSAFLQFDLSMQIKDASQLVPFVHLL